RDMLDIGDFIEVVGRAYLTKREEKSINTNAVRIITKSLRPIPSEWYGLSDTETRFRKRYLDLLLHPELKELFRKKSRFWKSVRDYLLQEEFLEVETPVLEQIPGGADAKPFITHHHALDINLYLRISLELHLKRLIVGGFEKIFEIGRVFRNEGIDDEHLQDYTQMELYWAYKDYNDLMPFIEKMVKYVIKNTFGTLITSWHGEKINWAKKWQRIDYFELLNKEWGIDASKISVKDLYKLAEKYKVKVSPGLSRGRVLDYIYKKTIRPKIIQPHFLINPPVDVETLAKRLPGKQNSVQRFQILAMGSELGKGFSELNDPLDQRARFEEQMRLRAKGDEEAQMMDEDFVEALEYGMPPTAGFGMSERLFAMVADKSVRETVFFPLLRPEGQKNE
ncbi:MAG TPA: lysine--tRNA ligase, partial [Candidatus Paceibacterota bacterium]